MPDTPPKLFKSHCATRLLEDQSSLADHPVRIILEQIGDKWCFLILAALNEGPLRFNAIKRSIEGVTQKSLTQSLRRLERNGIIQRRIIPTSPVGVEYEITPLGHTLAQFFQMLHTWTNEHLPEIERAHQTFDQRNALPEPTP